MNAGEEFSLGDFHAAAEAAGRPVLTAPTVARHLDQPVADVEAGLHALADAGTLRRIGETNPPVWYPAGLDATTKPERIVVFPDRRQIVVDRPDQYTRAKLSTFAHLVDSTGTSPGTRGYIYEVSTEDVWNAPFEDLDSLLERIRATLPRRVPALEEWVQSQWTRATQFTLRTHEEGYTILEAASADLMGNVARQKLDEQHLRAPLSDTEAWVAEEAIGAVKQTLYEAGYPVRDRRDLDSGSDLAVTLTTQLREYQKAWVDSFRAKQAGVFVGPPGSGKTVAAIGAVAAVGGETLILVPSRELADQWAQELRTHTDLSEDQVGLYHGGQKTIRPVTIATYQTAGMDRHRSLFESREWGLIIYDEVHHISAPIYRRTADLQTKHRLGLSATPIREDDKESEIFTLIGPPVGTDWDALFDAGYVQEPEVEIRYVPWRDETARNAWASADGREKRGLAARNPAKIDEIDRLRERHSQESALIFVDYLDQGQRIEAELGVPFVSGDTPHRERRRLFDEFRAGDRRTLVVSRVGDEGIDLPNAAIAIVASGLGGSRRQGTQRAGRTMRPSGTARMYVLATRGTREEEFARRRTRHLSGKGVRVTERTAGNS